MPVRRVTRQAALLAVLEASTASGVAPQRLTVADYAAYRLARRERRLPSHATIALLWGDWRRACADAARLGRRSWTGDDVRRDERFIPAVRVRP
jgi:hypothetical protein